MESELDSDVRHRLRGVIEAVEGRAEQLIEHAEREARLLRQEALADALEAIERLEHDLDDVRGRLLELAEDADSRAPRRTRTPAEPRHTARPSQRRWSRASMHDRPVAALFGVDGAADLRHLPD